MITLYSTGCPKCDVLIEKLNSKNIDYSICSDTDIMSAMGIDSVPVLDVDGTLMDFMEAIGWVNSK